MENDEVTFPTLILCVIAVIAAVAFASASISRGNEVRSLCRELAVRGAYVGSCESWTSVASLHRQLLED